MPQTSMRRRLTCERHCLACRHCRSSDPVPAKTSTAARSPSHSAHIHTPHPVKSHPIPSKNHHVPSQQCFLLVLVLTFFLYFIYFYLFYYLIIFILLYFN